MPLSLHIASFISRVTLVERGLIIHESSARKEEEEEEARLVDCDSACVEAFTGIRGCWHRSAAVIADFLFF